jgi:tRNA pseudouridine55 synthase
MSSAQAANHVRKLFGAKKAGHTGTLDVGAAGVLPVCIGRATKIADYIMRGGKEYIAEICFGRTTDTLDSYGTVSGKDGRIVGRADIEAVIPSFVGSMMQQPPIYSALKQNGVPLYKLALRGEAVKKPPRKIEIYGIEILDGSAGRFLLKVNCSKGTYIRSLVYDIARSLDTVAYMSFLLRTKSCGFGISASYTLDELALAENREKAPIPVERALDFMDKKMLPDYLYDILVSGAAVDLSRASFQAEQGKEYAVYCKKDFIGIYKREDGLFKVKTMIYQNGAGNA